MNPMRTAGWRSCLSGLVLALTSLAAFAQSVSVDAVRFRNLNLAQGLSQSTVRSIVEDADGFLWLGTQDGLNRFDGYEFVSFHRDRGDPGSIGDSHVTALALSDTGELWIGTMAGGLARYLPATRRFVQYRHRPGQADSIASDNVIALLPMADGSVLVATGAGGLQRLHDERFEWVLPEVERYGAIRSLIRSGTSIWFGGSRGLWHSDPAGAADWQRIGAERPGLQDVQTLAADGAGGVYVGSTRHGVLHLDAQGEVRAHHVAGSGPGALPDNQIRALLRTRRGELWVGTMNGVAWFDGTSRFLTWRHDASDLGSPAGNRIAALHETREGLIVVGTWTGGVSIHNPETRVVRLIRAHGRDASSLPANPVRAIWRDPDGTLWLSVLEGGGLVHYDLARGVLTRYVHDPDQPDSPAGTVIQAIARTPDGSLWLGMQGAGLSRLREGRFEHFRHDPADPSSLPDNVVQTLKVTRDGELWIGTESGGLARWLDNDRGFERYRHDPERPDSLPYNSVYYLTETRAGELLIGTFGAGLARLDRATGRFEHWREIPGDLSSISHNSVTMITEARDGGLWIGTQGGGLNRAERVGDGFRFTTYGKPQGLGAEAIGTVVEDAAGTVWIGTTVGVDALDPQTGRIRRFSASEGMDRSGYFIGSAVIDDGGNILFGGLRGALVFNPQSLPRIQTPPRAILTRLDLNNAPALPQSVDPDSPLALDIGLTESVVLPHTVTSLSIGYAALNLANPDNIRYRYRLDGFDADWIDGVTTSRLATYTNLPAGDFRFRVQATDAEGRLSGPERQLDLRLQPPWWRAPVALLAYALLVLGSSWLIFRRARARWIRETRAAEAIARSEQRLKLALWASREELWDIDLKSGLIERENLLPVLGAQSQISLPGREDFQQLVHPEDQKLIRQQFDAHVRGETAYYENTFRIRNAEGEWRWILSRGMAVERDTAGRARRVVGTSRDVTETAEAAEALKRLNDQLEARVAERTAALSAANRELQDSLEEIRFIQRQLVQSEKMAALGNLVAGISHEINTPIGISVTAASHLEDETRRVMQLIADGKLSKSVLNAYQADAIKSAQLILNNLRRASQLVRSFKQVAVDQSSEEAREFPLKPYLDEVLLSLGPALKKTRHQVRVRCPEDLTLYTYPGALSQILVNLVMNSLIHAFEDLDEGEIRIECERYGEEWLLLYRDNGQGMDDVTRQRVFEPFFTTKRGNGGSGLGLHVVFNLVTQLLRGHIECMSTPGRGVEFQIAMPVRVKLASER
ncbi:MAG: ATP-binding protein [Xanthomonadales bacterium]|jgi:PAS domain S-box-containing protein|nr:ATP-binding protein [Xanthomonadales bacterium]